jgi:hypothetical protein
MKKLALCALAVLLVPVFAHADGDPGLYVDFGEETRDVIAGETVTWTLAPANFGFTTPACPDTDTFCVALFETADWFDSAEPPLGECHILDPGYLWWQDVTIYVPCDAAICDYDTLIFGMYYCDDTLGCRPDIPDCLDPTFWDPDYIYQKDTMILHVVEAPPSLYILQDSIYFVGIGQSHAYVPFSLCNGDPCAEPTGYSYSMTSKGHIPGNPAFPQSGSTIVDGGGCEEVYAVVNASFASPSDTDTLTIVAWDTETGSVYDTCVQIVMVVDM